MNVKMYICTYVHYMMAESAINVGLMEIEFILGTTYFMLMCYGLIYCLLNLISFCFRVVHGNVGFLFWLSCWFFFLVIMLVLVLFMMLFYVLFCEQLLL